MSAPTGEQATDQQSTDGQQGQQQQGQTAGNVVPPNAQQGQQSQQPPADPKPGDGLPDDPAALKAEILRLRGENASSRTNAKQAAADQARKELAQQIGKALGIVEGDEVDPAKLTEQLAATKAAQAEAARELAVFKAAATAGADPARLLDSRSFLATIADIDPTDSDAIAAAIKVAVDANPTFKTTQAPVAGASTVDHAGGSGEGAVTAEQFKAMGYGERVALYQSNKALYDQLAAATIK